MPAGWASDPNIYRQVIGPYCATCHLAQTGPLSDAARFTHRQTDNVLGLEDNLFALVGAALKAKGHNVEAVSGAAVGGYQGILFTPQRLPQKPVITRGDLVPPIQGVYRAGSDHRKDGQAVGW